MGTFDDQPIEGITREDALYAKLKDDIRKGRLSAGVRIMETDLADAHGVSRAVVRSVLRRLEAEGLVQIEPYKGARVPVLTVEEIVKDLEIRQVLEGLASRLAAKRADADLLEELQSILKRLKEAYDLIDVYTYSECNGELHRVIGEASGNTKLLELLDALKAHSVRYVFSSLLTAGRMRESLEEHSRLVRAIVDRDEDRAELEARAHMESVINNVTSLAEKAFHII